MKLELPRCSLWWGSYYGLLLLLLPLSNCAQGWGETQSFFTLLRCCSPGTTDCPTRCCRTFQQTRSHQKSFMCCSIHDRLHFHSPWFQSLYKNRGCYKVSHVFPNKTRKSNFCTKLNHVDFNPPKQVINHAIQACILMQIIFKYLQKKNQSL